MRSLTARASLVTVIGVLSIAACSANSDKGGARTIESPVASSAPEPAKLAPAPPGRALGQFWPTKICTRGPGTIVVSNSCVCDSKMTCAVKRRGSVLDLHVEMSPEVCKDCGTFLVTCTVPPDARGLKSLKIMIDGKPVLDALELPPKDEPRTQHCYE